MNVFQVLAGLGKAALGLSTVLLGYPVEGFFAGGCSGGNCYPWYCAGPPADAVSVTRQGVRSVGFGCVTAGGMSGGAVFAQVAGRWAVVSLVSVGPRFDSGGRPCSASPCFYGHNVIGPEFTAGFFDQLWEQASSVP